MTTRNILRLTRMDLSKVQLGQSITIPFASYISVDGAREASLLVKVPSATFAGTGAGPTFSVQLTPTVPTEDGQVFGIASALFNAGPQAGNPPTSGSLYTGTNLSASTVPLGGWVTLGLVYTQYATTVTSAVVNFSVDLVLKS